MIFAQFAGRLRRLAGGPCREATRWRAHDRMAHDGWLLVRAFYAICLALHYTAWARVAAAIRGLDSETALWPVAWMAPFAGDVAAQAFFVFSFAVGFAAFAAPGVRAFRCLAALSALFHAALYSSWGGINHSWHEMVWIAALLCLLPSQGATGREANVRTIMVVASVALMLLMFYSLSGAYKVWHATVALLSGEFGGFSPFAMAHTVARRAAATFSSPPLAEFIIYNPWVGWPLYLGVYYIEFVAILVAFRPRLLPIWGLALIAFHLGTVAFLGIAFPQHILWNALFLVMAPQARQAGLIEALAAAPGFGWIFRRDRARSD